MRTARSLLALSVAIIALLGAANRTAVAQESSQWRIQVGVYPIRPQESAHAQLDVGDGAAAAFSAAWLFASPWGVELMATAPVEHDVYFDAGKVALFRHAPIALTLQRRFLDPNGRVQAHLGAGVAYSSFFDERTVGALEGAELALGSTQGLTAQAGLDIDLGRQWSIGLSARWFDLDVEAAIDGAAAGALELDPYAVGLVIGRRLR